MGGYNNNEPVVCSYVRRTIETRSIVTDGTSQELILSSGCWEVCANADMTLLEGSEGESALTSPSRQFIFWGYVFQFHIDDRDRRIAVSSLVGRRISFRKIGFVKIDNNPSLLVPSTAE